MSKVVVAAIGLLAGVTQLHKQGHCEKSDVGHGGQNYLRDNVPPGHFWGGVVVWWEH
ncbi:hypothetical protein [Acaryochloris sp. CCMEE 5410]|uniref:hypothetical protein n=1 Tax=Acaryochloris sp. CCMEE 5410 TaxID=310037 RepID=UPI001585B6D9|nr:hypothetical protein [Acaryochloris sp. CCMEE 5410]KAI9129895.1 hypothetical protein ON05_031905 [Acaryochloris sp. CCMEE 5410]KAI9129897.1 hypothetical protein ON05_032710 [Acaryochloris sp. CCMEE 5410]